MKKPIILILVLIAIVASVIYLLQPERIVEKETGEEITLGPIGDRVPAEIGVTAQEFALIDYDNETQSSSIGIALNSIIMSRLSKTQEVVENMVNNLNKILNKE